MAVQSGWLIETWVMATTSRQYVGDGEKTNMKFDEATTRKILELAGILPENEQTPEKPKRPKKKEFVQASFVDPGTWIVPVQTVSEANHSSSGTRQQMIARVGGQRKAVSQAMGPHLAKLVPFAEHYHEDGRLLIVLTRLGGGKLDKWDNLPRAMKTVLDAVCLMMGANDGSPLILVEYDQKPGGLIGVKIELRKI